MERKALACWQQRVKLPSVKQELLIEVKTVDDDFYRSQARIAHNMLHLAFAKLDDAKRKEIQLRAEPLLEKVAQRQGADEDEKAALELIRASLRQILRNEAQETSGDVETVDMAKSALNIFACIARV